MSAQTTVTVTYAREGVTLLQTVGLAAQDLSYEPIASVVLSDDEYESEVWLGFTLINHTARIEKQASA